MPRGSVIGSCIGQTSPTQLAGGKKSPYNETYARTVSFSTSSCHHGYVVDLYLHTAQRTNVPRLAERQANFAHWRREEKPCGSPSTRLARYGCMKSHCAFGCVLCLHYACSV